MIRTARTGHGGQESLVPGKRGHLTQGTNPPGRHGNVLVLTALLQIVLFAMVAFAIDVGYVVHARTELQRTADACALGAAMKLPGQTDAIVFARQIAQENYATVGPDLAWHDVVFGYWDRDTATFNSPAPSGRSANAVRVTLRRSQASGNPLRLFFAPVVGNTSADATASAIAWYDRGVCGPFVGIESLTVGGGAVTNSFDSVKGPYNPGQARDRGSVCSDGPVDVSGNSVVRGDALAGKGQPLTVTGAAVVTGYRGNRRTPLNLPPVDASAAAASNDNDAAPPVWQGQSWRDPIRANGDFSLNAGEVYDLPPGTYYFRNVTLNGGATLNISGLTKMYVTGTLRREGGCFVNNNTQIAQNLQINLTGGTVDVTSDNPFYGVIYAPQSRVTLNGDADLFGAIVGQTLKANGSGGAHYDESLNLDYLEVPRRTMLVD